MGSACSSNKKETQHNGSQIKIHVTSFVWNKNSHNLFDFESNQLEKGEFEMEETGKIIQIDKDILSLGINEKIEGELSLFHAKFEKDCAYIVPEMKKMVQNDYLQLWQVVRDTKEDKEMITSNKQRIDVGDIIKLGRVIIKVTELKILTPTNGEGSNQGEKGDERIDSQQQLPGDTEQSQLGGDQKDRPCCRICLFESSSVHNPLISPCLCAGSMKYLHVKCIQKWVSSQLKTKNSNSMMLYYWKKLKCEICKENYKMEFKHNDRVYSILDIPKPKSSYVMFQINSKEKNRERGIYVIELNKKNTIKIGRIQECDIKLNDISVSRSHATISLDTKENALIIEDNGSKFGTLVMVQRSMKVQLSANANVRKCYALQVGRSLINIEVKKRTKSSSSAKMATKRSTVYEEKVEALSREDELHARAELEQNFHMKRIEEEVVCHGDEKDEILVYDDPDPRAGAHNTRPVGNLVQSQVIGEPLFESRAPQDLLQGSLSNQPSQQQQQQLLLQQQLSLQMQQSVVMQQSVNAPPAGVVRQQQQQQRSQMLQTGIWTSAAAAYQQSGGNGNQRANRAGAAQEDADIVHGGDIDFMILQ